MLSLSELPDRFVGFNLSLFRHPLRITYTLLSIISIIEYILKRILRKIYKFGYLLKHTLKNKFALELLFDYSVAKKGYFREIFTHFILILFQTLYLY